MEETKKVEEVEIISKEKVEGIIETLEKAEKQTDEETKEGSRIDFEKTKEVLKSFEGCSVQTGVSIITSAMLLLPLGAIMAVLDMGKSVIKAKAMAAFFGMLGGNDHAPKA